MARLFFTNPKGIEMPKIKTIRVVADGFECGFMTINAKDFDQAIHEKYEGLVGDDVTDTEEVASVPETKEEITAMLDEMEVEYNKNLGVKKLGAILAEALEAATAPEPTE